MSRFLVFSLALLLGLIVIGRRFDRPAAATEPPVHRAAAPPVKAVIRAPTAAAVVAGESRTPTIDLLARLEGRRRLVRAERATYFDSLFIETDSVVRRWPDGGGVALLVAIPPGDSARYDAPLVSLMRRALAAWEDAGLGVHFIIRADTAGAQIAVRSMDQLGGERAGQTDLQWTRDGAIHTALITLARRDSDGRPIPDAGAYAVAVHEIGHALGLAHSPLPDDVMFQATRTGRLSQRDRATLSLLYELPLGTVRESLMR